MRRFVLGIVFLLSCFPVFSLGENGIVTFLARGNVTLYSRPSVLAAPIAKLDQKIRLIVLKVLDLSTNMVFDGRWYYCKAGDMVGWIEQQSVQLSTLDRSYLQEAGIRTDEDNKQSRLLSERLKATILDFQKFQDSELIKFNSPTITMTELKGVFQSGYPITLAELNSDSMSLRWVTWQTSSYLTDISISSDSKYWALYLPEFSNLASVVATFGIAKYTKGWLEYPDFRLKAENDRLYFEYSINTE